jgi:hypothetical protein
MTPSQKKKERKKRKREAMLRVKHSSIRERWGPKSSKRQNFSQTVFLGDCRGKKGEVKLGYTTTKQIQTARLSI